MKSKRWGDISWPVSTGDVSGHALRDLDENEFQNLRKLIRGREQRQNNSKSHVSKISRKLTLKRRREKRTPFSKAALLSRHKECELLDSFVDNRKSKWRKLKQRVRGRHIRCENFSFIDNPINTFETLRQIALGECEVVNMRIDFVDQYVQDIGPYLFLGLMREKMAPLTSGGKVSGATVKVLEAVGLRDFLQMQPFGKVPMDDVWPFPIRRRRTVKELETGLLPVS